MFDCIVHLHVCIGVAWNGLGGDDTGYEIQLTGAEKVDTYCERIKSDAHIYRFLCIIHFISESGKRCS
jgi:hypothetical protein